MRGRWNASSSVSRNRPGTRRSAAWSGRSSGRRRRRSPARLTVALAGSAGTCWPAARPARSVRLARPRVEPHHAVVHQDAGLRQRRRCEPNRESSVFVRDTIVPWRSTTLRCDVHPASGVAACPAWSVGVRRPPGLRWRRRAPHRRATSLRDRCQLVRAALRRIEKARPAAQARHRVDFEVADSCPSIGVLPPRLEYAEDPLARSSNRQLPDRWRSWPRLSPS